MVFFAVYAMLVWILCFRSRRTWTVIAFILMGVGGVVAIGLFHWMLNVWSGGKLYLFFLQSLLYPYGCLLLAVSIYLALLPRPTTAHAPCRICGYELAGLDDDLGLVCPECGRTAVYVAASHLSSCGRCNSSLAKAHTAPTMDASRITCPNCKAVHVVNPQPQPPVAIPA